MARSLNASRPGLPGRILVTSDSFGDVWEYSRELCAGLSRKGFQISLAVVGPPLSEETRRRISAIPKLQLLESPYATQSKSGIWSDLGGAADWLLGLERSIRPDVIHANSLLHAAIPWTAPVVVVAHRCMMAWWQAVGDQDRPRNWEIHRKRVVDGLRNATLIVAPTSAGLSDLSEQYGSFLAGRVIPYGHDYRAPAEEKKQYIITAAHFWDDGNNLEILELIAPYLSWPMFMAGHKVDTNGTPVPPRNMCALGPLDEAQLDSWLAKSSIYAMPARYLTCSMSVLRAAAAGCALVLASIPSLRETWDGAAVFVPPGDREAVRMALEKLLSDSGRRREFQQRARERAASLTGSAMVDAYARVYHDAIRSGATAQRALLSESLIGA